MKLSFFLFLIIIQSAYASEHFLKTIQKMQDLKFIPYYPIHQYEETCLVQNVCLGQSIIFQSLFLNAVISPNNPLPKTSDEALLILEKIFTPAKDSKMIEIPGVNRFQEIPHTAPYTEAWSILTKKVQANVKPLKLSGPLKIGEYNKTQLSTIQKNLTKNPFSIILIGLSINPLFNYFHPLIVLDIGRAMGGGKTLEVLDPKDTSKKHTITLDIKGNITSYSWWEPQNENKDELKYFNEIMQKSWLHFLGR